MCFFNMGKHKEWRKIAKKMRRKRIRTKIAEERNERISKAESSPRHQAWLVQQSAIEEAVAMEEELEHERREQQWLTEELRAQQEFKLKQLEKAKHDKEIEKQKEALKAEIEARAMKKKLEEEAKARLKEEQERLAKEREQRIEDFLQQGTELPEELRIGSESHPGKPPCPFFSKVAACRFGDTCSRNHIRPSISKCILFAGMFSHPSLGSLSTNDNQAGDQQDWSLEFAESEVRSAFLDFFNDIANELGSMADLERLLVSCNSEPHLRGNVYAQFCNERDALKACRCLAGRWYAGRRLQPCFVTIPSWRQAICGLQNRTCPKGRNCNFLHVFHNPVTPYIRSPPPTVRERISRTPSVRRDRSRSLSPWSPGRRLTERTPRRSKSPSSWSTRSSRRKSKSPTPRTRRRSRSRSLSPWSTRGERYRKNSKNIQNSKRKRSKSPSQRSRKRSRSKTLSPVLDKKSNKIKSTSESRFSSSPEINILKNSPLRKHKSKKTKRKRSSSKEIVSK